MWLRADSHADRDYLFDYTHGLEREVRPRLSYWPVTLQKQNISKWLKMGFYNKEKKDKKHQNWDLICLLFCNTTAECSISPVAHWPLISHWDNAVQRGGALVQWQLVSHSHLTDLLLSPYRTLCHLSKPLLPLPLWGNSIRACSAVPHRRWWGTIKYRHTHRHAELDVMIIQTTTW